MSKRLNTIIVLAFVSVMLTTTIFSQTEDPFTRRADDVIQVINGKMEPAKVFSDDFLAQVSAETFAAISKQLLDGYGKAVSVKKIDKKGADKGVVYIVFEKESVGEFQMSIQDSGDHKVNGLLITGFESDADSLAKIVSELKTLPGTTNFLAKKIGKNGVVLAELNPDLQLAVGSTMKLYVLSELQAEINSGKRKWGDVVTISEKSLPSGQLQNWEMNSPITLNALASMMISVSDNTATDILIDTLGREKIEAMMATTGNSNPNRSTPFVKTSELFKLKAKENRPLAEKYIAADIPKKRALLATEVKKLDLSQINIDSFLETPTFISQLEWFASPNDLANVMDWLRTNSNGSPNALGVLTINKALSSANAKRWKYVGFKGGSEPGVINLTYLLQNNAGDWFVVTGGWNNEAKVVEEGKFVAIIQRTVNLLAQQTSK